MNSFSQALLLWSWQALLLVGIVALTIRLDRSRSAASRHALWTVGICLIALLPAANLGMRALPKAPPLVAPISYVAQLPTVVADVGPEKPQNWPGLSQIVQWMILGGWTMGTLVSLARSVTARVRWKQIVANAFEGEAVAAPVPIRYSRQVDSPVLVGALRPVILLPYGFEAWADENERRAMVEHELAHVARRDHWLNILQAAVGAVFFFHPAVRYALRQLEVEREIACDERVLAAGISPATYADLILKVAERSINGSRSDCPAFNASAKDLERRISMVFRHSSSTPGNWKLATAAKAFLIVGCTTSMLLQPSVMAETPPAGSETQLVQAVPEQTPGAISGTVTDATGALVPGVQVQLIALNGQPTTTAITNREGVFIMAEIAPGLYSLRTALPDFGTTDSRVEMRAGDKLVRSVLIPLARIRAVVEVTASKPAIVAAIQAPTGPRPLRIGGVVSAPNLITQTKPQYPAAARASGAQGPVQLLAVIGKDGAVTNVGVDVENPQPGNRNPELVKAAMEAVQQWRYRPMLLNGQPMEFMTSITVNFALVENQR